MNNKDIINNMSDEDQKEYFESLEADYWINEYKNNHDLM